MLIIFTADLYGYKIVKRRATYLEGRARRGSLYRGRPERQIFREIQGIPLCIMCNLYILCSYVLLSGIVGRVSAVAVRRLRNAKRFFYSFVITRIYNQQDCDFVSNFHSIFFNRVRSELL